jgi:NAD(P)-dependent dehydrogenase (short-subunit alcohol dehydrogenase family)
VSSGTKRWLITGCSTGIGRAITLAALDAGDSVLVTARRPETVQDLVDAHPGRAVSAPLDITDRGQIVAAVEAAHAAFGGLDVLVNNAGYGYLSAVEEGDDAEVRALFDTNFFGAVDMVKAVLPGMRGQGSGHIVNVSSMTGIVTNPPNTYYSATKHALEALTEGLAKEVGPLGIKVCAIEPGAFQTDYITRSIQVADSMGEYAEVSERKELIQAFGEHLPGDPAKLAAAVLQLVAMDDPPLRLLLGKDVLHAFREKTAAWQATVDEWEPVTTSVNLD